MTSTAVPTHTALESAVATASAAGSIEAATAELPPGVQRGQPRLEIEGGLRLSGEIRVSGAKNSALVLMAACLLTPDVLRLRNVPLLTDIAAMGEILAALGVQVQRHGELVELDGQRILHKAPPYELVNSLRASFFCIGPLLARLGIARVPLPGGCQIGRASCRERV